MEADAQAYDELSKPQIEIGSQFIRELNLDQGNKVLDMGCGTGILTKFIADIVGSGGQAVGIDPDAARIKIAKEKFNEVGNLQFHIGNTVTGFPHDNEPYYDVHISTFVYHWLSNDEKKLYIQKAYQCLKPGGKLAILCVEFPEDRGVQNEITGFHPLTQDGYRKLFKDVGLFPNVVVENKAYPTPFKSFEGFMRWFKASTHDDSLDPAYVQKYIIKHENGSVTCRLPFIGITANKK